MYIHNIYMYTHVYIYIFIIYIYTYAHAYSHTFPDCKMEPSNTVLVTCWHKLSWFFALVALELEVSMGSTQSDAYEQEMRSVEDP